MIASTSGASAAASELSPELQVLEKPQALAIATAGRTRRGWRRRGADDAVTELVAMLNLRVGELELELRRREEQAARVATLEAQMAEAQVSEARVSEARVRDLEAEARLAGQRQLRIAELETQLADERTRQPEPDLTSLSDVEVALLASESAATILRTARTEAQAATASADEVLAEAQGRAEELRREAADWADQLRRSTTAELDAAREGAEAEVAAMVQQANDEVAHLCGEALLYNRQARADADAELERMLAAARADADALRQEAQEQAAAHLAAASAEADRLVTGARAERQAFVADSERQHRMARTLLDGVVAMQAAFADGYTGLRQAMDQSSAQLVEPLQRVTAQIAALDELLSLAQAS